jgi:hypothetical protein
MSQPSQEKDGSSVDERSNQNEVGIYKEHGLEAGSSSERVRATKWNVTPSADDGLSRFASSYLCALPYCDRAERSEATMSEDERERLLDLIYDAAVKPVIFDEVLRRIWETVNHRQTDLKRV